MLRSIAATLLAFLVAVLAGGPARAADWPTAEDCMLYDAAFKAVIGDEAPSAAARRVGFAARERPLGLPDGDPGLGSELNLKVCVALKERIYAAGMTFEPRPAFGFRLPGTPYYEHFSRTATQGGKVRVTYWKSPVSGVNVTLSRAADGGWTVDSAEDWVTGAADRR
jgi:hypothetical protein